MKKRHAADLAAESQMIDAIRAADHFLASLFLGVGRYRKTEASTVRAALKAAAAMEASSPGTQRCMIYAVGADGRATFLTAQLINRLFAIQTGETTMTAKPATKAKKAAKKPAAKKAAAKPASKPAEAAGTRARYDWTGAEAKAESGKLPPVLDLSAPTHKPFLGLFDEILKASKAEGTAADRIKALKAIKINPTSSTPKALDRYRNLCVKALNASAAAA